MLSWRFLHDVDFSTSPYTTPYATLCTLPLKLVSCRQQLRSRVPDEELRRKLVTSLSASALARMSRDAT